MEQTNGILVLVKRDKHSSGFDVAWGMRHHNDIPDTCRAVGNRLFLEAHGLKVIGDFDTITGDDAYKEWLIGTPFHRVVQELGETGSGFEVLPKNNLSVAWSAFGGDLGKGLRAVWRGTADLSWFLLLYDSASYQGGTKADDSTFGSSLYAVAIINSGLYWLNPKSPNDAANPADVVVAGAAESVWLQRLKARYPDVASKLVSRVQSGGAISGEIDNVACNIWWLGQLWLTFLDGDDFGLTDDREIYDHITQLATQPPRCSIEDEAWAWMQMRAANMSKFEIKLGLDCAVESVGTILIFNGNYDDTYQLLVQGTHRDDISD